MKSYDNYKYEIIPTVELWKKFIDRKLEVNCRTEEEAIKFLAYCEKKGLKWRSGNKPTEYTRWSKYKEKTCYLSYIAFGESSENTAVTYSEMFKEKKKMKTYKTWEAIKMLTENPKLKFKGTDGSIVHINEDLAIYREASHLVVVAKTSDEWTLIQEPVSFMEAAKALYSGKTIRVETEDKAYSYSPYGNGIRDEKNCAITISEILNGKWFIQVEEE